MAHSIVIGMQEIFDNILNRRMDWPDGGMSAECRDLIDALLQVDPDIRLGHGGASELKEHPWFAGLDWDNLARAKAAFVPQLDCESDTSYFDFKEVRSGGSLCQSQATLICQSSKRISDLPPQGRGLCPDCCAGFDGPCWNTAGTPTVRRM